MATKPDLIHITEIPEEIKRLTGITFSPATCRTWVYRGLRGQVLPSRKIAGRVYVERRKVKAFIERERH